VPEHCIRDALLRGRLSTVDRLNKVVCFVISIEIFSISKGAGLNELVQGGQLY
jgi:hypothetical protein